MIATLRQRIHAAFTTEGFAFPGPDKAASHGGAVVQAKTKHSAALVCVVSNDEAMARQHGQWCVRFCVAAGWPQPDCERWIVACIKARAARQSRAIGKLRFELTIAKGLVTVKVKEVTILA